MAINLCMGLYVYHIASTCAATVNDHHASLSAQHLHSKTKPATFRQWLLDYPDTPGATLVRLLQQELHVTRTAEAARLRACRKESLSFPVCFGGLRNAAIAEKSAGTNDNAKLEKLTLMPLSNMTVFDMRRYTAPKKLIFNLGTDPVCFALVLAGASVTQGVIVELGTFTGLSTKCLALGLNATGQPDRYYAFDIFGQDVLNYQAIIKNMPWVTEVGTLTAHSSYKWLWELAVQQVYPTIQGFEGFIDKDTVNPKVRNKETIALLSVDSAKMWGQFRDQLAGIQSRICSSEEPSSF